MNLLGAKLYDPGSAATKATSSLLAMTAFDTTNLRLAITVPAHGMVRFKIRCMITGATTAPTVLLGVLNGATVVARVVPLYENATANAATQNFALDAEFTATGLTPGAANFDAAYAVQVVVASTNIKYGGPNNNSGANAWGAFLFEAWDPQPLTLALDGGVNLKQILGTNVSTPATAGILDVNVKNIDNDAASASGTVTFPNATLASTSNITAAAGCAVASLGSNVITAASINAAALNGKGDWNIGKTGYALSAAGVQAIWDALTSALTTVGSIGKKLADWTIGTAQTGDAFARLGAPAGASIAADIAAAKTDTAAIKTKTDNLPASPAAVGSAMTLTSGERTSIANEVEAQIIDETDSEKVLTAITDKIAAVNPSLGSLTVSAIAAGVRTNLSTELGRIDAAISSRGTGVALDAAGIRTAVGLATANLDTQIGDVPTNSELTASLAAADDAVLAAIGGLNNVSSAQVQTAAAAALTAYDPPTRAEATADKDELLTAVGDVPTNAELATALGALNNLSPVEAQTAAAAALTAYDPPTRAEATSDKDEVIAQVNANETKIDGIKTKTDSLTFTRTGEVDANVHAINDTAVGGTGAAGDEWGPE